MFFKIQILKVLKLRGGAGRKRKCIGTSPVLNVPLEFRQLEIEVRRLTGVEEWVTMFDSLEPMHRENLLAALKGQGGTKARVNRIADVHPLFQHVQDLLLYYVE